MKRPRPPERLFHGDGDVLYGTFIPAPEVEEWVRAQILEDDGLLFNEDHGHLRDATLGFLWTNVGYIRQGRHVAGTAEMPMFRCGAWQKARQEQQMREWFGDIPDFLITLDANYADSVNDATFAALVEHELYHCAQEMDEFGERKFTRDGLPKLCIRGHDVEEFVGVVRRYGVGSAAGATAKLVEAAKRVPEVAQINIARACGTCLLAAA